MKITLPDPEARKFLSKGSVETVATALSAHVFNGLEVIELTKDAFLIRLGTTEVTGPTEQQLKHTVRMANALFGVV